jgi:L-2-hydroxycarboxylate dehydrogenase (NAD+)
MSTSNQIYYVEWSGLKAFATEALVKAGVIDEDAAIVADTLVEADLRGVDSHGVVRLAGCIRMISEGNMNPRPKLRLVKETPTATVMDADDGIGNLVCVKATEIAIQKAKRSGVGIVGVRNSTHCGALAYYPMLALKHDMIGFMATNVPPSVPAYGGLTRLLGTNPYAVAIPAGDELPVVLDMATTMVAAGKIRLKEKLRERIPPGWALDGNGEPTEDAGEALSHGFLSWMGSHKGYCFAVLANILSGVLTGSAFGPQNFPPWDRTEYGNRMIREGHFIAAMRIDNFMPVDEFKSRMDAMIREAKASKPVKGVTRVYLPGGPEFEQKEHRLKTGIPISQPVWEDLLRLRERLKLSCGLSLVSP